MRSKTLVATLFTALIVGSAVGPAALAASSDGNAVTGATVSFRTDGNAIVDYSVEDDTVVESMTVQSRSNALASGEISVGIGLAALTDLSGSVLSLQSSGQASTTIAAGSGATIRAHDSSNGILVVDSSGGTQYVTANVSSDATVESESDDRVVVTTESGTTTTFIAVGDADVVVNDAGNVSAEVGSSGSLVARSYAGERTADDEETEEMIADGTAAAEVYVRESADASGEFVAGVANYSQDTAVEVTRTSEGQVEMTAERAESEGRVVITSVSEAVIESMDDVSVTVDGEAAAEASSYSELRSAADGGDNSRFLVRQSSSAEASADVLIAINHFSERDVTVSGGGGSGPGLPGFGVGVAVLALLALAVIAARRR